MSDCSTHAYNVPLKSCPFCGREAALVPTKETTVREWFVTCGNLECSVLACRTKRYYTEAEAIAAWNNRAPIEYDGWFYLPKPKDGIVDYGEPEITRTENGYKVRQFADVVDEAARKWGDELGEYAMKRICEVWNSRAERTCECTTDDSAWCFACSECGKAFPRSDLHLAHNHGEINYCPNCGAKVVGE